VIEPGQDVRITGDSGLVAALSWGSGGFIVEYQGMLQLTYTSVTSDGMSRALQVNAGGSAVVSRCTFRALVSGEHSAVLGPGGGVFNLGTLVMADSTIDGYRCKLNGQAAGLGTIQSSGGDPCGASKGGGIFSAGSLSLTRCSFSNNRAWREPGQGSGTSGGGVYLAGGGTATIEGCTFSNNACDGGSGGAIASYRAHAIIQDCQFIGNSDGGANRFAIHLGRGIDGRDLNARQAEGTMDYSVDSDANSFFDRNDDDWFPCDGP
jgi:hypothetical protein